MMMMMKNEHLSAEQCEAAGQTDDDDNDGNIGTNKQAKYRRFSVFFQLTLADHTHI